MRIIFTAFFITSFILSSYSQGKKKDSKEVPGALTYVNATAKLKKNHNLEELKPMGKIELVNIYMERISVLTELLPYIALNNRPGATLNEMGIPATAQNVEHMMKEVKNKENYLVAVKNTLDDIIPYADKTNIIWSILFIEETIKSIESPNIEEDFARRQQKASSVDFKHEESKSAEVKTDNTAVQETLH